MEVLFIKEWHKKQKETKLIGLYERAYDIKGFTLVFPNALDIKPFIIDNVTLKSSKD